LSRIHAAITIADREITVEDRGSVNGTMVNGTGIAGPTKLSAGDRVAFANVEFRVDVRWTEGI
jgi:pSer/pThr/pTyr-binding forkhead associated (FHA) protein